MSSTLTLSPNEQARLERAEAEHDRVLAPYRDAEQRRVDAGLAAAPVSYGEAKADEGAVMYWLKHFECPVCGRLADVEEAIRAQEASRQAIPHLTWDQLLSVDARPAILQAVYGLSFEQASEVLSSVESLGLMTPGPQGFVRREPMCPTCLAERREVAPEPTRRGANGRRDSLPPRIRYLVLQRDGFRCVYCGATAREGVELQVDHVVPVAHGGSNEEDNLVTACRPCNLGKSDARIAGL